jgi:outer membrane biosynthesis protein TonB
MACLNRMFARIATSGGWTLLVLVLLSAVPVYAQSVHTRLRGGPDREQPDPSASSPQPAPPQPTPAQPVPAQPAPQPQAAPPVNQVAPSMLQQPAGEAQIVFTGDTLSIRADNSSLAAILHQVAGKSGMQIEGLSGDERVFGSFGPGAPRDVLADLLNGTAYNVVLLGDLSNGAPRQLILTPATHGGAALTPPPQANADKASNEPEPEPPPPPPEPAPSGTTPPPTPGVKTPQQLFEQLQRMRSAQQQQVTTPQDPQQQQQQAPQ